MINADAVKTSAGALNLIPVVRTPSLKNTLLFLRDSGLSVFAATEKAESVLYSVNLRGPVAIVIGSEESGISPDVLRTADHLIKIPIFGKIGSLNVSAAASIVMFEVVRQRMQAGQPGI
jgi:23S rRNA (guanosine2251-2'-O)-methyltransferase